MLLVTLDGVGEVSQCGVNGTHVAQLARLRQLAPGLAGQQDTLFVAGQSVGVVPYGGVHMAQAAEGTRRRLQSHTVRTITTHTSKYKDMLVTEWRGKQSLTFQFGKTK